MKLSIEISELEITGRAERVGEAMGALLTTCLNEGMDLTAISTFLKWSAATLDLVEEDPIERLREDAGNIAILSETGSIDLNSGGEADGDEAEGEEDDDDLIVIDDLQRLIGDLPALDRLIKLERKNGSSGDDRTPEWRLVQKAIAAVDPAFAEIREAGAKNGLQCHLDRAEWRRQASDEEIENDEGHIFLNSIDDLNLLSTGSSICRLIWDCVRRRDETFLKEIEAAVRSCTHSAFVFRGYEPEPELKKAVVAIETYPSFKAHLDRELAKGGCQQSKLFDAFAQVRDAAESWIYDMVEAGEVERLKRGNRYFLQLPGAG